VPLFTYGLGLLIKEAIATSLWIVAIISLIGGALGAWVGTWISDWIQQTLFAVLPLLVAV